MPAVETATARVSSADISREPRGQWAVCGAVVTEPQVGAHRGRAGAVDQFTTPV
jgi:hypothetical protein